MNDREFASALSLTDAEIAVATGKSRQAVNLGLSRNADDYFKDKDLADLYLFCNRSELVADSRLIESHVRETRSDHAKDILSNWGLYLTLDSLGAASFALSVMPAYKYFATHLRVHHELIIAAARQDSENFLPVTATEEEAIRFWSMVFPDAELGDLRTYPYLVEPKANAMPYTMFLDPHDKSRMSSFVLGIGGYQKQDPLRAWDMYNFLMERAEPQNLKTSYAGAIRSSAL